MNVDDPDYMRTQLANGASLCLLYDTHITCDVIMPSNQCVIDDVLLPQQNIHE
jgi:hypothetical protein